MRSATGALVPLSEVAVVEEVPWDGAIYHKDLLPVVFVTGERRRRLDSPLYGMFGIVGRWATRRPPGSTSSSASSAHRRIPTGFAIKWDGEWQITYETFRDMGLAYSVGLVLIYLLVVAQFRSYAVPLIIMAPIPLTIIGVMPGHALLGAQFTATSMIGMIALAGIIVRNSILLVDFIERGGRAGRSLAEAVIRAAAVRARPIALTALAAMIGAFFILDDPIFNGLAVSLIFGILVSTVLTLVADPDLLLQLPQPTAARLRRKGRVMARVVVLGAGLGGVPCAYELQKKLGKEHEVTLVGSSASLRVHAVEPLDRRRLAHRAADPAWTSPSRSRTRTSASCRRWSESIDAPGSTLRLADGSELAYDYLVITTGPEARLRGGARPRADGLHAVGLHARPRATPAWEALRATSSRSPARSSWCGAGRELLRAGLRVRDDPRHRPAPRKMRDRVPMTYVTSEPYIGHMGLGGVGDSKGLMESELRQRHIKWITNAKITRVEAGADVRRQEVDDRGRPVRRTTSCPSAYAMILPAFKGVDAVAAVPELCNPRGFVLIDEHQRSKKYPNIYSAGVCVAIPPVEATPVPTGAPKTGYMIESMVTRHLREHRRAASPARRPSARRPPGTPSASRTSATPAWPSWPCRRSRRATSPGRRKGKWVHSARSPSRSTSCTRYGSAR